MFDWITSQFSKIMFHYVPYHRLQLNFDLITCEVLNAEKYIVSLLKIKTGHGFRTKRKTIFIHVLFPEDIIDSTTIARENKIP